jgi:hypothetical protein
MNCFGSRSRLLLIALFLGLASSVSLLAQTAGTGAIAGLVTDASGAVVPAAQVTVTNVATGEKYTSATSGEGLYRFPLLAPGSYDVAVQKTGFKLALRHGVMVAVTEVAHVDLQLVPGLVEEKVEVVGTAEQIQTETTAMGRVTTARTVEGLPLVTRNYTQIITLSPGIVADVGNAGQLGRGGTSGEVGQGSAHAHGSLAMDNNFQMNGIQINDLMNASSGAIAIPNPDAIQEFKVQTSLYDASFGRNGGANVDLVTKSGSNSFHGSVFEFYRDKALNANDYFSNQARQPKAPLHQHQFGGTLGGPLKRDKLLFFTSYQGTRQVNGVARVPGASCSTTAFLPPLTDDRSPAAIGALFAGQRGLFQNVFGGVGPAVAADGSNINPVALKLLQLKNPDGSYYIPNPQVIDRSKPVAVQGFSVFRAPCTFQEDQIMANGDYLQSDKSKIALRYFYSRDDQTVTFPSAGISNLNGLPGSPQQQAERFHNASVSHTYVFSPRLVNEFKLGYGRSFRSPKQKNAFTFSNIGATAPAMFDDLPSIFILGCCWMGGGSVETDIQNNYTIADSLSWVRGKHNLRFGGGFTPEKADVRNFRFNGIVEYPTWPDFLLGLSGAQNGTGLFSNILVSINFLGVGDRAWTALDGYAYVQDDYKVARRLTLNLGLRYERLGNLGDSGGRNGNFDPARANRQPPASGTLEGYIVPSNFQGTVPVGVTKLDNSSGIAGTGQNTWGPRIGLAWEVLPNSSRLVLRSGYGVYYTRAIGQQTFQLETAPPFGQLTVCPATCNAAATAQAPFAARPTPDPSEFPIFRPYSPTTANTIIELAQNFRPPITQQYTLGLQAQLANNLLLEVAYVGSRGTHLIRAHGLNQAGLATPSNPINGITTTTFANINQRLPYPGFTSGETGVRQIETEGASWYNGLETSLTKRLSHGLQFLASYTWSKTLSTDGADPDFSSAGLSAAGNQLNDRLRYGPSFFSRDHRFVISYLYDFPSPADKSSALGRVAGGWSIAGVTTIQTGNHLTLTGRNANNYAGITNDKVQLTGTCSTSQIVNSGAVQSKLNNYFNLSCISPTWPVIGSDGRATDFGDSGVGIVTGPGQHNFDIVLAKATPIREAMTLIFRAEFFNAFNTPQFDNPGTTFGNSDFGVISGLSTNPRIVQLVLKLTF